MKLINRDTDYAIKALMRIARNDSGKISVSQLSRELGIPYSFLRKILHVVIIIYKTRIATTYNPAQTSSIITPKLFLKFLS